MRFLLLLLLALGAAVPASCAPRAGTRATLAILETTDLHANVLGYDYFKLAPDASYGLERTATLIAQARRDYPNTLLLDDGDTIEGSALGDHAALPGVLACSQELGIYRVLDYLGVEGGTIGNHDFDFGLSFLQQVTGGRFELPGAPARRCAGPRFPLVLANIVSLKTRRPLFPPYRILDKQVTAIGPDGKPVAATVRVGIIGFTPPTVMAWSKRWLDGMVRAEGMVEAARRYVPEMRAKGADVVVALAHSGLDAAPYDPTLENAAWYLADVPGAPIDALLIGHSHLVFPDAASSAPQFNLPGVDKVRGTVHGVPAVMAGLWGKQLGVVALPLQWDGKAWRVDRAHAQASTRSVQDVAPDPEVARMIAADHAATMAYVRTPIGRTEVRLTTYFGDAGDASAVAVVNLAQADYVRRYLATNFPDLARLPVLSMAALFKSGSAGARDFTDVAPGPVALNHAADLYLYPNTLAAVRINGAQLKAWLEKGAQRFNRIDPTQTKPQELVNAGFAGFNFDMLTTPEVRYEIDVTAAPGARIVNLRYRGAPLDPAQQFIVATNSFRTSSGFGGLQAKQVVFTAPDSNRDAVIAWIRSAGTISADLLAGQRSWSFLPVQVAGPVLLHSAPGMADLARQVGLSGIVQLDGPVDDKGLATYRIDLGAARAAPAATLSAASAAAPARTD